MTQSVASQAAATVVSEPFVTANHASESPRPAVTRRIARMSPAWERTHATASGCS